jgi:hypothetical protein
MGAISLGGRSPKPHKLKDVVSKEDYDKLVQGMLESNDVKTLYERYIKKDIPFEKWVKDMVGYLVVNSVYPFSP